MERHFRIDPLDPLKLIKVNDLKEVTNPIAFARNNVPTSDGLISNEIFGITKFDRSNTYAYISLGDWFMHPLHYKVWSKLDSNIKAIIHETEYFKIDSSGNIVKDPEGDTGIAWLMKNIDKIKIKSTESSKRDRTIEFLKNHRDTMFINNIIIIPAYYRDANTTSGKPGLSEINKLYQSLMMSCRSLKENAEYGFSLNGAIRGRIQEQILTIYQWFSGSKSDKYAFNNAVGIPTKMGIMSHTNLNKTTDYAARLVLSAPELKVDKMEDLQVDLDHSAVPLAGICTAFFPFIQFHIRRFFENEFSGVNKYPAFNDKNELEYIEIDDYQIAFSDEVIRKELDLFQHGYADRFRPIRIPTKNNMEVYMNFKGYNTKNTDFSRNNPGQMPIVQRRLTWLDIIYQAAVEVVKDKHALITRYPIDTYFNQFPTKLNVLSTKETEPMVINSTLYTHYPKIREKDINTDTSNKFIDTMNIANAYLKAIGGDYELSLL